jgi:hypothetical protein
MIWSDEPDAIMKDKEDFDVKIRDLKGPMQFQEHNLEHVGFQHLHCGILGLSYPRSVNAPSL